MLTNTSEAMIRYALLQCNHDVRMNTLKELAVSCKTWKVKDNDGFKEIVSSYITITGNQRVLADEFEAAVATVCSWASGFHRPRLRMKMDIVAWIGKQAEDAGIEIYENIQQV